MSPSFFEISLHFIGDDIPDVFYLVKNFSRGPLRLRVSSNSWWRNENYSWRHQRPKSMVKHKDIQETKLS